jgi:hypothetical protein
VKVRVARVSGIFNAIYDTYPLEVETQYQIHRAMRELFKEGCRRFRTIPMPRTSDVIEFKVMGWPA